METLRAQEASSSSASRYSYDVFLSFRGQDTRKTFTDHLYKALTQAGFRTFRDNEELEPGKHVKSGLNEAIQKSRLSLIVLSKGYASSKWCLDELLMILECKKISGHLVVPIFYHMEPSDVRHQKGSLKEAFDRHEEKLKEEESKQEGMERVNKWKAALKEVADLSGKVLQIQSDGYESTFIEDIVKVVNAQVDRPALKIPRFPVGLYSRAKSINLWLNDGSADVDMLVIWGTMGGMGKTTIAKFVYNLNKHIFERSCFLENINREICNQSNALLTLQRQLLSKILRGQKEEIFNVDEGTTKIEDAICLNQVFIVLDDVDDVKQLDILIGTQDFYRGSKIIITTRNKGLLIKAHKIRKLREVEMKMLDDDESLKLFSWHAFGQDHPLEGYTDQSIRVLQRCRGLPLALEVLGCSLYAKGINVWKSALQQLEAILNPKIQEQLKISYDLLENDNARNIFLHIACFFVGEDESYIVTILNECGYYTEVGMQNLIERSLLRTDYNGKVEMHPLIQEMGREIVRQQSPEDPGKRTRLWHHKDSFRVMKGNEGTESIEGLVLDMHMFLSRQSEHTALRGSSGVKLPIKAFKRMKSLRLLQLKYVQFTGRYKHFPTNLRWLSWHGFPEKSIPTYSTILNLVALDMRDSKLEQVWERTMVLPLLQILDLSHSQRLRKVHHFLGLQNLERLILKGCVSLIDICDSICNLERLVVLDIEDCKKLKKLPRNIRLLRSLEGLVISGCSNLAEFQCEGTIMNTSLTSSTEVKPWNVVDWSWLFKPKRSPICLSLPRSLVFLSLQNCNLSEDSFPKDFSQLSLLRSLQLGYNPIKALPESIKSLTNLQILDVSFCERLRSMIGLPSSLLGLFGLYVRLLEKITFESRPRWFNEALFIATPIREVQGFFRMEPIGAVDSDLINDLGLINLESLTDLEVDLLDGFNGSLFDETLFHIQIQGLHEFGIFSTWIPMTEVPSWFSDENRRLSSSFIVPSPLNNYRIRGLSVCAVYEFDDFLDFQFLAFAKIHNETKNLTWIYHPMYFGRPKNMNEDLVWLSHWRFGNQLEGGDIVTVTVVVSEQLLVKEIGVNLVYGEMEDNVPENIDDRENDEVIGGDLTNYQLSTGAYFLSHNINYFVFFKIFLQTFGDTLTDLIERVFGDNFNIKELEYWCWTGRNPFN